MSFILDALRKVEREDPLPGPRVAPGPESPVARLERSKRRRQRTLMVAIAVASAGLTAAALRLVSEMSVEVGPHAAARAPEAVSSPAMEPAQAPQLELESSPSGNGTVAETGTGTGAGESSPARSQPAPASEPSEPGGKVSAEPASAPSEHVSAPGKVELPAEAEEESESESEPQPDPGASPSEPSGAAIRLVGPGSPSRRETDADATSSATTSLPAGLPRLVLQGTSVVDGHPVAVISDRRVFEGDHIEGALVVRIEERSVELEFEGRRFTLLL